MADNNLPPIEYLRECFEADPETGILTWKHRPPHHFATSAGYKMFMGRDFGKLAFNTPQMNGYLHGGLTYLGQARSYMTHRILIALYLGHTEIGFVDHLNRNRTDNRACNLRLVSGPRENGLNATPRRSLPKGVSLSRNGERYLARGRLEGKVTHFGTFDTMDEAEDAVLSRYRKAYGDWYRP